MLSKLEATIQYTFASCESTFLSSSLAFVSMSSVKDSTELTWIHVTAEAIGTLGDCAHHYGQLGLINLIHQRDLLIESSQVFLQIFRCHVQFKDVLLVHKNLFNPSIIQFLNCIQHSQQQIVLKGRQMNGILSSYTSRNQATGANKCRQIWGNAHSWSLEWLHSEL